MADQIPAVPLAAAGAVLVTAINDRIRRINLALGGSGTTAPPKDTAFGAHAERVSRPVLADATLYVETDRNEIVYQAQGTAWQYVSGAYRRTQAQLAALALTLGAADIGLLVFTTDTLLLYRWSGAALLRQDDYQPTLADTHANRLASFPSVRYAVGQEFWETDRTARYIVQNAVGTVTVTLGTTVTWTAGHHFINSGTGFTAAQWPAGTVITIAGVICTVAAVASPTVLTLASATTNAAGVAYSVASGRWEYAAGKMQQAWASLPTDLGENDAAAAGGGFEFFDRVDSLHIWEWTGSAWTWGPGDRHSGEFGQFDADPGTGWHACDGAVNQTKYAANGTRVTNFTVPDQREFYLKASATYTGAGVAAAAPGLSGSTAATTHSHGMSAGNAPISAIAATATAAKVVTAGAGTNVADNLHTHPAPTISGSTDAESSHVHAKGTLAVDALGTPPTFAVLPYYRL